MSPASRLHPEFEYFCPSRSFRRKAGIALAFIAFGVIGGALVLRAGYDPMADMTLMIARVNGTPFSAQTTSVAGKATATTTAERSRPPEGSKAACEEDTWAYLDGKCIPGRARKARSLRSATDGALGRSALPTPAPARLPPKLASGADAAATAPAAVKSTGQSNPVLKKARKTALSQNSSHDLGKINSSLREERGRDDQWSARAYALPDNRNPPGLYERSWGWSR